jgi:hypothetical protein
MKESPLRQRNGDQWARTVVVRLAAIPPEQRLSEWRFALAAAGGLAADALVLFSELMLRLV